MNNCNLSLRRQIWIEKNKLIKKHNEEASKGKHTFKMAHNELSDKVYQ